MAARRTSKDKQELRWPRDHFSWSQYSVFKREGAAAYCKRYIYGDGRSNPAMELGKAVAKMVEDDREQTDQMLEHLRVFLPIYDQREYRLEVPFNGINLLGFLDGFNRKTFEIGEYKTGRLWTQQMADKAEQLDWYALMLHLKFGVKPEDISFVLHWMPTETKEGEVRPTGDIQNFPTRRTTLQILTIGKNIIETWRQIGIICAKEYKALGL